MTERREAASVWRLPLLRRLILPVLAALAMVGAIEFAIDAIFHPGFWQRTTWLMYDPYHGEIFDRVMLWEKLSHFEDSDPEIISVGDSSGFFGIQSKIVNRYTHGVRYLSLNTGANYAYQGYRAVAEYMLKRSPHLKYVVIYVYPQLLPEPYIIQLADLAPIVHDSLVGAKSKLTPPSAFFSPYAKYEVFDGYRYHFGDFVTRAVYAQQLNATVRDALGWLPEFDVRIDRVNGQLPYFTDRRSDLLSLVGLRERSSIYATLDDFNNMVKTYGATLAVAFAPVSSRAIFPNDPHLAEAELAMQRFSTDHPEVKFLFPLISRWSPEKFGTANHISREYTFLSSMRLGQALGKLVTAPDNIGTYKPTYVSSGTLPTITSKVTGSSDPSLLRAALALYLYTSTLDPTYRSLISKRVLNLLDGEPAYHYMMDDQREREASLSQRKIDINFDLSKIDAHPIDVTGMTYCGARPDTQWVQLSGIMTFTYRSPGADLSEPVRWPERSHIFIPTIVEDGVRKFDGYCREPSLAITSGE